jgi:hypothetical protein
MQYLLSEEEYQRFQSQQSAASELEELKKDIVEQAKRWFARARKMEEAYKDWNNSDKFAIMWGIVSKCGAESYDGYNEYYCEDCPFAFRSCPLGHEQNYSK